MPSHQVEGNIQLWWSFRSLYVLATLSPLPVNVPGWLTATTLATRAPGKKIPLRGDPQRLLQANRGRADETSL
jgi:hypothetical protein